MPSRAKATRFFFSIKLKEYKMGDKHEKLYVIRSVDRTTNTDGTTPTYARFDWWVPNSTPIRNIRSIKLVSATIPNAIPNVNTSFTWTDTNGTYTGTVPQGFYSIADLTLEIQTLLNAQSSGYTVAYNNVTAVTTISNSILSTFTFTTQIATRLGFVVGTTSSATTHSSTLIPKNNDDSYNYIKMLTPMRLCNYVVPIVAAPLGSSVIFDAQYWGQTDEFSENTAYTLTSASITLTDIKGNQVNQLADWEFVVSIVGSN
jgi:hypothetical protein